MLDRANKDRADKFQTEARPGAHRGYGELHRPGLALRLVPSRTSVSPKRVSQPRTVTGELVHACLLLLALMLSVLVALGSELAVFYAVGTAVRMLYGDSPGQQYDAAGLDRSSSR